MELGNDAKGPENIAQRSQLDAEKVINQPDDERAEEREKADPKHPREALALMVRVREPSQLHKRKERLQPERHLEEDGMLVVEIGPRDNGAHQQQ